MPTHNTSQHFLYATKMVDNSKFEVDVGWQKYKEGMFLTGSIPMEAVDALKDFKLQDADTLCVSYPKTGG